MQEGRDKAHSQVKYTVAHQHPPCKSAEMGTCCPWEEGLQRVPRGSLRCPRQWMFPGDLWREERGTTETCPPSSWRSQGGTNVAVFTSPLRSPGPCRAWAAGCGASMAGRTHGHEAPISGPLLSGASLPHPRWAQHTLTSPWAAQAMARPLKLLLGQPALALDVPGEYGTGTTKLTQLCPRL